MPAGAAGLWPALWGLGTRLCLEPFPLAAADCWLLPPPHPPTPRPGPWPTAAVAQPWLTCGWGRGTSGALGPQTPAQHPGLKETPGTKPRLQITQASKRPQPRPAPGGSWRSGLCNPSWRWSWASCPALECRSEGSWCAHTRAQACTCVPGQGRGLEYCWAPPPPPFPSPPSPPEPPKEKPGWMRSWLLQPSRACPPAPSSSGPQQQPSAQVRIRVLAWGRGRAPGCCSSRALGGRAGEAAPHTNGHQDAQCPSLGPQCPMLAGLRHRPSSTWRARHPTPTHRSFPSILPCAVEVSPRAVVASSPWPPPLQTHL